MEGLVRYRSAVIIGGLLWILCLILGISWQYITTIIVKSSLSLSPSSIGFQMWRETPIPMYMEFYLFNWTNPDKVKAGLEKPHVQQLGPYTYREKHTRVNMTWHLQNDSITYRQFKEWHFVPSMSSGTEEDRIVSLNVMAATIADKVKNYNGVVKKIVSVLLNAVESLAINRSAREWLFDGFSDPVLNIAKMLDKNKILNISIPFDKFGWFYSRNMSASYDGVFNLYTGQQSLSNLGNVHSWNYATHTLYFNDSCGDVKGSTGELIHPLVDDTTLTIFSNDLCSFLTLSKSEGKIEKYGIEGVRFEGDISEFDNGTLYPKHKCFTYNGKAMPNGVRDMSKCRFGAPAYVSFPHFLDADSWYVDSVVGMKPNKTEHNFFISVEPNTGLPLDVRAQMQINILLQPVKGMSMFAKVPRVVMPMFFFRQTAELTPDLSSKLKLLLNLPLIGYLTFFGFFVLLSLVFAVFLKVTWRLDKDDNVDDDDESLIISAEEPSNSESVQQISQ